MTQSVHGNACCKRLFARSTEQAPRVPASIQFSPPPTSPKERSIALNSDAAIKLVLFQEFGRLMSRTAICRYGLWSAWG